ncbi:MAG: O-antigen ligase family protein [Ignavibacteriaceae bacterium]
MAQSRFDIRIPFYLTIGLAVSFVTSMFFMQFFAALLGIFWLIEKYESKKKAFDVFAWFVLAFGLIRAFSVIFSIDKSVSVEIFYKEILFYFAFFSLSFYLKIFDKNKKQIIIYTFIGTAAVVALSGIIKFDLNLVQRSEAFTTYTTFASYLLVAFAFALSFHSEIQTRFKYYAGTIILILLLSGIITSLGRTVSAITVLVFLTAIIFKKITIKTSVMIVAATVVICFVSFNINKTEVSDRIQNPGRLSDRDVLIKGAEDLVFKTPVWGFGPITFHEVFPYADQFGDKGIGGWHNDLFQVYFESGIPGLISFLALLIFVLWKSFAEVRKKKYQAGLSFALLLGITGLFLTLFTIGFVTHVVLSIVFAFLVSLLSSETSETITLNYSK